MSLINRIIEILDSTMKRPEAYGGFHLFFIVLSLFAAVLLCKLRPNPTEKFVRKFLLFVSLLVLVLEFYKQTAFTHSVVDGALVTEYQWYAFPFQFCSTPMYVGFLAAIIKNEKIHRALTAYLSTFSLFAGLCVMVYPNDVFVETIGVNVQTMICHGSMITIALYLIFSGYVKAEHKTILHAIPVFACCVAVAMGLNEIAHLSGLLDRAVFNMFFISPYCEPSLPVYSIVQQSVPYPWCLIIYVAAFSLAAYAVFLICMVVMAGYKHAFPQKSKKHTPTSLTII